MIELVNKATGERIDLRFVDGLSIDLGGVSPEVYAEFVAADRWRQAWRERAESTQGLPADAIVRLLSGYATP